MEQLLLVLSPLFESYSARACICIVYHQVPHVLIAMNKPGENDPVVLSIGSVRVQILGVEHCLKKKKKKKNTV